MSALKFRTLIFLLTSFCSCCKYFHSGEYILPGTNEFLNFETDSTFEYSRLSGFNKSYSKGTWSIDKQKHFLYLNSVYHTNKYPLFATEQLDGAKDFSSIQIDQLLSRNLDTVLWMALTINDTINIEVEKTPVIVPKGIKRIETIRLTFFYNNMFKLDKSPEDQYTKLFRTINYKTKDSRSNVFILTYPAFELNMFNFYDFQNEVIAYKKDMLFWSKLNKRFKLKRV